MDGVLTDTARCTRARGRRPSTPSCATRHGDDVRPFDLERDYERLRGRQAALGGVRDFLASRGIEPAGGQPGRPARRRHRERRRQAQERARPAPDPTSRAWTSIQGSRALRARRARRRPPARPSSPPARNTRRSARGRRHRGPLRRAGRRRRSSHASISRASRRPDSFLAARAAWRRAASTPRCSKTRSPASRPAAPGGFGYVVGVDRPGHAEALREHGADVVVRDLAELVSAVIDAPRLPRRAVGRSRARARPRAAGPDRVDVRARQRAPRPARQPRRGRAARRSAAPT